MKRIQFTPDASIRAIEQGGRIEHTTAVTFALPVAAANHTVHYFVGLTPEWWEIVLLLLERSGVVHGEAMAESIRKAFQEMTLP